MTENLLAASLYNSIDIIYVAIEEEVSTAQFSEIPNGEKYCEDFYEPEDVSEDFEIFNAEAMNFLKLATIMNCFGFIATSSIEMLLLDTTKLMSISTMNLEMVTKNPFYSKMRPGGYQITLHCVLITFKFPWKGA